MFGNWNRDVFAEIADCLRGRASLDGQPRAAVPTKRKAVLHELVAAGVVLVGDQDQARADGDWFRL